MFSVFYTKQIRNVHINEINTKYWVEQGKNLFSEVSGLFDIKKFLEIGFTAPDLSLLGGLSLVSKAEKSCGIIKDICHCIDDWRDQNLIDDIVSQRVMQMASGYEEMIATLSVRTVC